jgi:hypothetical protein
MTIKLLNTAYEQNISSSSDASKAHIHPRQMDTIPKTIFQYLGGVKTLKSVKISISIPFTFIKLSQTGLYDINYRVKMFEIKPH